MNWYNILERALWTFLQAFLAVFLIGDLGTLKPAIAAGLAAVLSMVKTIVQEQIDRRGY
jgi:uncharacterized membrane protein YgaE (UPF0421/DUF939 family)